MIRVVDCLDSRPLRIHQKVWQANLTSLEQCGEHTNKCVSAFVLCYTRSTTDYAFGLPASCHFLLPHFGDVRVVFVADILAQETDANTGFEDETITEDRRLACIRHLSEDGELKR